MKNPLENIGNTPVRSSVIASLFPQLVAKSNKVSELEKNGEIIRLKRGLYVVSPEESGVSLSLPLIANHLYAPSYVSMLSALRYYGLTPEAVYTTQSMTIKHARDFETPVGLFTYNTLPREVFPVGLTQQREGNAVFIMATPEKALCDLLAASPGVNLRYRKEALQYLEENLRLDMDAFYRMQASVFEEYVEVGKKAGSVQTVLKLLKQ